MPWPEQSHSVSQSAPMKFPAQVQMVPSLTPLFRHCCSHCSPMYLPVPVVHSQLPASQAPAARAAAMPVWVPWPEQSHGVRQWVDRKLSDVQLQLPATHDPSLPQSTPAHTSWPSLATMVRALERAHVRHEPESSCAVQSSAKNKGS